MSEALRLAKTLEYIPDQINIEAAAELRRLHAENEALLAETRTLVRQNGQWQVINAELVEAMESVVANWTQQFERYGHMAPEWCKKARVALAKVEASK